MIRMEMRLNGRPITSTGELARALSRSVRSYVEKKLKEAAGPRVRLQKTRSGYLVQGTREQIERYRRRLR